MPDHDFPKGKRMNIVDLILTLKYLKTATEARKLLLSDKRMWKDILELTYHLSKEERERVYTIFMS